MSEQVKTLVPKLRFPEFKDLGEWEPKELNQLGELVSGLTYSPEDVRESGLLVLRSSNVQNGHISLDDSVYVTPSIKGANLARPNDILICVRNGSKALIGKNALIPDEMPLCTHGAFMTIFRSPTAKFVFQLFQTDSYQNQVDADLGATINSINGSKFLKYKFCVPQESKEQQKIADCLSSLDDLITAQNQKVEALKQHKKGLMQQLFPGEGETVPKRRFAEFVNDKAWGSEKLGNLIDTVTPPQKLQTTQYQLDGKYPIFDQSQSYICGWTDNKDALVKDNLPLIIFGDHTCALKIANTPFAQGADGIKILQTKKEIETQFFYQILQFKPVVMEEYKRHFSILKEKVIIYPDKDTGEQQKIADCLSSLDDLITVQTQKHDTLKTFKKGLMQQLFPSLDEGLL